MTNLKIANELYSLAEGLTEVINKRTPSLDDQAEKDLIMNLMGARDKAKRLSVELAKDEAIEQEINLAKDRESEKICDEIEIEEQKHGEERDLSN